jgi:hypothetical protein
MFEGAIVYISRVLTRESVALSLNRGMESNSTVLSLPSKSYQRPS